MSEKIGSCIIDILGKNLTDEENEMLNHPLVGGVILFARNYESRHQLKALCQAIRSNRKSPLLIMVDQEGGRVQRFVNEFTRIPPMHIFGTMCSQNIQEASVRAKDCGWLMATELLSAGLDLSLAPVIDLNKGKNDVIGKRAFHADPAIVEFLAASFINGMEEAGMAATGKHFPGHGDVHVDSHHALPIDERTFREIEEEDLRPFLGLKNKLSAIMAAHIHFPRIDDQIVGYSSFWLKTVLRDRIGFKGAIFSDDLNMEGANISSYYPDRAKAAREAGCDFFMLCNNRQGVIEILDNLPYIHQVGQDKWNVLQGRPCVEQNMLTPRWRRVNEFLQKVNCP